MSDIDKAYKIWWDREGSGMCPENNEDLEEFAGRITDIAWSNGAYCFDRDLKNENDLLVDVLKEIINGINKPIFYDNPYFYESINKAKEILKGNNK